MNYVEALNYINDVNKFGTRPGLESIGKLLDLLGNPQKDMKYIHVAGTNGKGSTSSYMARALKEADYKVGLFTSPFIERFNERISINGKDIPNNRLANITKNIKEKIEIMLEQGYEHPTTFEIITSIAFAYFKEENVDYVVLEVGLGGRLDCTNIIDESMVSIITTIDYDHIDLLGDTLEKIAFEKSGIIKNKGLVISYPQKEEVMKVIEAKALEEEAELYRCPMENITIKDLNALGGVFDFKYKDYIYENIEISLLGKYQVYNATLALYTLLKLREKNLIKITDEQIREGIKRTSWMGRMEMLKEEPGFLIDGAHNLQAAKTLAESLKKFKYKKLILGIAMLGDKDVDHVMEVLAPLADQIVITEVNMPRKMDIESFEKIVRKYNSNISIEKDIKKAIDKTYELAEEDDLIVFAGSLYLIGDVRKIVLGKD